MIRVLVAAVLIAVILSAVAGPRASAHTGTYCVNAGNGLNLRTGPGGSYRRILTMPNGACVTAMGHRGSWMKLRYNGTVGWAWLEFLVPGNGSQGTASPTGTSYCMTNLWGEWVCASPDVANAIRSAASRYGISQWWLFALAACESSFNPWAYNPSSGVSGLMQFQPSTFYWQGGTDLWNYWQQALVAAKMMAHGLGYHFDCLNRLGW